MSDGRPDLGADYVIVPYGKDKQLGLVVTADGEHAVVRILSTTGDPTDARVRLAAIRRATAEEIYEYGDEQLKNTVLGEAYGTDEGKTMWDLMNDNDRQYWRSLRPEEQQ